MEYLTTTHLRTKSSQLVATLKKGGSVSLIHRSQIIGQISPTRTQTALIKDLASFKQFLKRIKPTRRFSTKERKRIYRGYLTKRYGPSVS